MTGDRRPTRATVAGRAYLDLQNLAHRQQRPTDELHQLYALGGFLVRLTRSVDAERLVLKTRGWDSGAGSQPEERGRDIYDPPSTHR